jgi:two-component system LytT family response regulator
MNNQADMLRAVILDDERLARARVKRLLRADTEISVVGEFASGREFLGAFSKLRPDLLFLDVQMPGLDGFETLAALPSNELPAVVFVTAFDQYAVKAFETYAVDYLLKPYDTKRFEKAVARAKEVIRRDRLCRANTNVLELIRSLAPPPRYLERLTVRQGESVTFIKVEQVDWIEAEGNYVRVHFGGQSRLIREPIGNLEKQLDPKRFPRIHRSAIVNFDRIAEISPLFHGECRLVLCDGTELTLSRTYRDRFPELQKRMP